MPPSRNRKVEHTYMRTVARELSIEWELVKQRRSTRSCLGCGDHAHQVYDCPRLSAENRASMFPQFRMHTSHRTAEGIRSSTDSSLESVVSRSQPSHVDREEAVVGLMNVSSGQSAATVLAHSTPEGLREQIESTATLVGQTRPNIDRVFRDSPAEAIVIDLCSDTENDIPRQVKSAVNLQIVLEAYPWSPTADIPIPAGMNLLTEPFSFSDFWLHVHRLRDSSSGNIKGTDIDFRALESLGYDSRLEGKQMDGKVNCDAMHELSAHIASGVDKRVKFIDPISVAHICWIGSRADVDANVEFARRHSLCFDLCAFEQVHFICRINGGHWLLALFEAVVDDVETVSFRLSLLDSLTDSSEVGGYVHPAKDALVGSLRLYLEWALHRSGVESDAAKIEVVYRRDVPQQNNTIDCGIYSLLFSFYASFGHPLEFGPQYIPFFRRVLAQILLTGTGLFRSSADDESFEGKSIDGSLESEHAFETRLEVLAADVERRFEQFREKAHLECSALVQEHDRHYLTALDEQRDHYNDLLALKDKQLKEMQLAYAASLRERNLEMSEIGLLRQVNKQLEARQDILETELQAFKSMADRSRKLAAQAQAERDALKVRLVSVTTDCVTEILGLKREVHLLRAGLGGANFARTPPRPVCSGNPDTDCVAAGCSSSRDYSPSWKRSKK